MIETMMLTAIWVFPARMLKSIGIRWLAGSATTAAVYKMA
jgi:hypothetical protein